MTSSHSEIKMAVISDIHLGHPRNKTLDILLNLYRAFPDNAETAELDIIFIAGDVFDTLLYLSDPDVWDIKLWVADFLRLCKKHDILLRVLEGTPSHDRKQSEMFLNMNTAANIGANLEYVKNLSVEYIQPLAISVLYVPDEADETTDKTLSQVKALLKAKGLQQVDFSIMHGAFEHQLPPVVKCQKHDVDAYLGLTRHLIFIGHIHQHSIYKRVYAQGSFDRLAHGEEEPKGHLRAKVDLSTSQYQVRFIENQTAKRFDTISCTKLSLEDTLQEIHEKVKDLPKDSYVRLEVSESNPILENMDLLVSLYPQFTWSKIERSENIQEEAIVIDDETSTYIPILITPDNIKDLILSRIALQVSRSAVLEISKQLLNEVIDRAD